MASQATALSPQTLIEAAKASVLAYNDKDWDRVRTVATPDVVYDEVATGRKADGIDQVLLLWQGWARAFPDSKAALHNAIASGSTVMLEITWNGTHKGLLETPSGPVQPTGKTIAIRACMVVELEGERVKRERHYFDMATLAQQLGL
ncbi:MAG: ester cyclase [Armatimonadetes bacterium]|nr:ester cyclase [Armatimonadota bacterium]